MRIASVKVDKNELNGLSSFSMDGLERVVILAGENGSGKTRLLKMIERVAHANKNGMSCEEAKSLVISFVDDNGIPLTDVSTLSISNYSHSDLPLQSAQGFPPYVINISEDNLRKESSDFEQTAREALLYLTRLAKYATIDDLKNFNINYCDPLLGGSLEVVGEKKEPALFGHLLSDLSSKPLSPGQKYLLRLCVALNCNIIQEGAILFLDEPESHLHPKALLELFEKLKENFKLGQIWIATHSVELISRFYYSDVWYMSQGQATKMGSKTERILNGMLGDDNKRYLLYQFISSPDAFACNAFAAECLCNPEVVQKVTASDASTGLVHMTIYPNDIIVDFGAGKGRFLESYWLSQDRPPITYYAYDNYGYHTDENTTVCSADYCKEAMKKYGVSTKNYFGKEAEFEALAQTVKADKVLLINVLHEIAPNQWGDVFERINRLLSENGVLMIVEREELTIGEKPFDSDFFVVQRESLVKLFSCNDTELGLLRHEKSKKVVAYIVPKSLLSNVSVETIKSAISTTRELSIQRIRELKTNRVTGSIWEHGICLAFWTHQFTNASLFDMDSLNPS
jgi:energy-coupling factor transporter ATP-binding protein EcfA2